MNDRIYPTEDQISKLAKAAAMRYATDVEKAVAADLRTAKLFRGDTITINYSVDIPLDAKNLILLGALEP